jgi:hypothetical protein
VVKRAHYRAGILDDLWHVDPHAIDAIARLGAPGVFVRTRETFDLAVPTSASAIPANTD